MVRLWTTLDRAYESDFQYRPRLSPVLAADITVVLRELEDLGWEAGEVG